MWEVNVHVKEKLSTFCAGNETDSEAQKIQPKRDFGRSVHQPSPCPGEKKQPGAVVMNTNSSVRFSSDQSVQSLSHVRLFATPWTAAHQASLSITNSGVYTNPCPLSQWCHPTISSSIAPFSSCPQSFPASGSFQMGQLFASGGQSIGVSASTAVLPMNT